MSRELRQRDRFRVITDRDGVPVSQRSYYGTPIRSIEQHDGKLYLSSQRNICIFCIDDVGVNWINDIDWSPATGALINCRYRRVRRKQR